MRNSPSYKPFSIASPRQPMNAVVVPNKALEAREDIVNSFSEQILQSYKLSWVVDKTMLSKVVQAWFESLPEGVQLLISEQSLVPAFRIENSTEPCQLQLTFLLAGAQFEYEALGQKAREAQLKIYNLVVGTDENISAVLRGDNPVEGISFRDQTRNVVRAYTQEAGTRRKRFRKGEYLTAVEPNQVFKSVNQVFSLPMVWDATLKQSVPETIRDEVHSNMIAGDREAIRVHNLDKVSAELFRAQQAVGQIVKNCAEDDDFYFFLKALFELRASNQWINFFIDFIISNSSALHETEAVIHGNTIQIGSLTHKTVIALQAIINSIGKYKPFFRDLAFYEKQAAPIRRN